MSSQVPGTSNMWHFGQSLVHETISVLLKKLQPDIHRVLLLQFSSFRNRCQWLQEDLNFLKQLTRAYWSKTRKSCSRLWSTKAALHGASYLLTVMLKTFSSQLTTPEVLQHIINLIQPCIREEAEGTASGSKRISRLVETEQQLYSEPPERKSQDRLSFMKETNLQNKNWVFHTAYQHQWRVLPRACVLSYMEVSWLHSKLPLPQELYERFPRSTIPWGLERKLQEFFII